MRSYRYEETFPKTNNIGGWNNGAWGGGCRRITHFFSSACYCDTLVSIEHVIVIQLFQ